MKTFRLTAVICLILLLTLASACTGASNGADGTLGGEPGGTLGTADPQGDPVSPTNEILITFDGNSYQASQSGVVSVSGNVLSIVKPGTYRLKGTLANAQIRIAVEKTEAVDLIFDGLSVTNAHNAPFYVDSADKVSITLAEGSQNTLTDATNYIFPAGEDKPNACLYSSEDLTIKGTGALTVIASFNNGIGCKNDLKIKGGTITVEAVNNALKGNESIQISGGSLSLKGTDGLKSDSTLEGEGIVEITGGTVELNCSDDGIQASNQITITDGARVTVEALDDDLKCDGTAFVAQGSLISK